MGFLKPNQDAMGKVVHFEIPFDEKSRAMKFYGDVFDWKLTDMPEMDYVMALTSDVDQNKMPTEHGLDQWRSI
jgi:hypothetical protein